MPISPNDTARIAAYLNGEMPVAKRLVFEAQLLLNPQLKAALREQKQVLALVKAHGRAQLRAALNQLHEQLFTQEEHGAFARQINQFFHTP